MGKDDISLSLYYRIINEKYNYPQGSLICQPSHMLPRILNDALTLKTQNLYPDATDIEVGSPLWEENTRYIKVSYRLPDVDYLIRDKYRIEAILEIEGRKFLLQEDYIAP